MVFTSLKEKLKAIELYLFNINPLNLTEEYGLWDCRIVDIAPKYQMPSVRLQDLQCDHSGDTTVLDKARLYI